MKFPFFRNKNKAISEESSHKLPYFPDHLFAEATSKVNVKLDDGGLPYASKLLEFVISIHKPSFKNSDLLLLLRSTISIAQGLPDTNGLSCAMEFNQHFIGRVSSIYTPHHTSQLVY